MARVIITGGTGFIGQLIGRALLRRGKIFSHTAEAGAEKLVAIKEVVLADVARPAKFLPGFEELESQARIEIGSIADASFCRSLFAESRGGPLSVFHLGAIMSGQGERDFDLCMDVNLYGTMHMLEAARRCGAPRPRVVMTSAGATLGSGAPTDYVTKDDVVADSTRATPHTSYGMSKACAELLLSDYSRRGFVDGRACRLPTVIVRAGVPNAATTACFSSVVREPLAGLDTVAPVDANVRHAVTSHRTAIDALLTLHELPAAQADRILGFDRTVFAPCTAVTLSELEAAVRAVVATSAHGALGRVTYEPQPALSAAVASFPSRVDSSRALALGMAPSLDATAMVRAYVEDFPSALANGVKVPPAALVPSTPAEAAAARGKSLSVALITGGGTGIGRAVALRLAAGGWQREAGAQVAIVLTGRRADVLEETAQEIRKAHGEGVHVLVHAADLTLAADVKGLFSAVASNFGRLDLLFNNAGANVPPTTFDKMEYADWRRVININLDAAFHVARDAYRMMRDQTPQGGRIINNGSISATTPRPAASAYTASKHAITGLTKSIALDGRPHQVACGQIDFGNVVSAISAGMAVGMPQADGSIRAEPRMSQTDAADAVFYMAQLPLTANVLQMTVMATNMPFVGRG